MPSRVSSQRLRGARETSAPHGAWSNPPSRYGRQGVLAGVAARAVAAVVAEGDRLGQGHVEPAGPGDAGGHLGHLQRMGQPGALVVVGKHEDLGLAGQSAEGGGVEDPVAVPFEAGAPGDRAPRAGAGCRRPRPGSPPEPAGRTRSASRARRSRPGGRPMEAVPAWLSAWAKVMPRSAVAGHGRRPAAVPLVLASRGSSGPGRPMSPAGACAPQSHLPAPTAAAAGPRARRCDHP